MDTHCTEQVKPNNFRPLCLQELNFDNVEHLMLVHGRYEELSEEQKESMVERERQYFKRTKLPTNRLDPFFYHVYVGTLPLEYHYRVVPQERDYVTDGISDMKKKEKRRRFIFEGWNNLTTFEKQQINLVKQKLKYEHNIDIIQKSKEFGPRTHDLAVVRDEEKPQDGVDFHFSDRNILRFLVTRQFNIPKVCSDLIYHLQWRQTNIPMAILTDKSLNLLNKGVLYIHGRCMDGTPIVYFDMGLVIDYLKLDLIDQPSICNLYNFICGYIQRNMLLPGQVEKWTVIINTNQCSLGKMPLNFFKSAVAELQGNYIDSISRCTMVNLTWIQNASANFLMKFCDPVVRARTVLCNNTAPEQLDEFIFKSQRQQEFGGTQPKLTTYWPPIVPPITETIDEEALDLVPRQEYISMVMKNEGLKVMPKRMREDLGSLAHDEKTRDNSLNKLGDNSLNKVDNSSFQFSNDYDISQKNLEYEQPRLYSPQNHQRMIIKVDHHHRVSTLNYIDFDDDEFEEHSYRESVKTMSTTLGRLNKTLSLKRPKSLSNSLFKRQRMQDVGDYVLISLL